MEAGKQESLGHANVDALSNVEQLSLDSTDKQTEFLLKMKQLHDVLAEKESRCAMLAIKLNESYVKNGSLMNELNECKLAIVQMNENSEKSREEATKSRKIEEDYVKLMGSFLELGDRYNHYRHTTYENYFAKTNAINNYECHWSYESLKHELDKCKTELNCKQANLSLNTAKLRNMEEENSTKEKYISELKKALDDARVTHKHEIKVLEEYVQSLKNTILSYEKTLACYQER